MLVGEVGSHRRLPSRIHFEGGASCRASRRRGADAAWCARVRGHGSTARSRTLALWGMGGSVVVLTRDVRLLSQLEVVEGCAGPLSVYILFYFVVFYNRIVLNFMVRYERF